MERIDAVLRPLELTFARYEVLRLLSFSSAGAMPMTRLGSLLQVHPTSVTSAVDRLERQGFVERRAATTTAGSCSPRSPTPAAPWSRRPPTASTREVFENPGLRRDGSPTCARSSPSCVPTTAAGPGPPGRTSEAGRPVPT